FNVGKSKNPPPTMLDRKLVPNHQKRGGGEGGRIGPRDRSHQESKNEPFQSLAAQGKEGQKHKDDRKRIIEGANHRRSHRLIHGFLEIEVGIAANFPDPVKNDNRVMDRKRKSSENCGHKKSSDFDSGEAAEQGKYSEQDQSGVKHTQNCARPVRQILEAVCDVEQDRQGRQDNGKTRLGSKFRSPARAQSLKTNLR